MTDTPETPMSEDVKARICPTCGEVGPGPDCGTIGSGTSTEIERLAKWMTWWATECDRSAEGYRAISKFGYEPFAKNEDQKAADFHAIASFLRSHGKGPALLGETATLEKGES